MEVEIEATGIMKTYFPRAQVALTLDDQATLADLYHEIGESLGGKLPDAIWNRQKSRFRGPVLISSNGQLIKDETTRLYDGQKIELRRYLVGG